MTRNNVAGTRLYMKYIGIIHGCSSVRRNIYIRRVTMTRKDEDDENSEYNIIID